MDVLEEIEAMPEDFFRTVVLGSDSGLTHDAPRSTLRCGKCDRPFKTRNGLQSHLTKYHTVEQS